MEASVWKIPARPDGRARPCVVKRTVPKVVETSRSPRRKPASPIQLKRKAFLPESPADCFKEIKTDQQVAAQADASPSHKEQQKIVGEHEREHEEQGQVEIAEEAVIAAFVRHITDGIDEDQQTDEGDHDDHHAGERIEEIAPVGNEVYYPGAAGHRAGCEPLKEDLLVEAFVREDRRRARGLRLRRIGRRAGRCRWRRDLLLPWTICGRRKTVRAALIRGKRAISQRWVRK